MKSLVWVFLGVAGLVSPAAGQTTPPASPSYAVIDLGQCSEPFVHGISNSGNVSWITDTQFCRWKPGDATFESASLPADGYDTYVIGGINDNGDVVGSYEVSPYDPTNSSDGYFNVQSPVYWANGSSSLGAPNYSQYSSPSSGYAYAEVDAINNDGSLYGCAQLSTTTSDAVSWAAATSAPSAITLFGGTERQVVWAKNGHTLGESLDDEDSSDFDWYLDGTLLDYSPASINSEGDGLEMNEDSGTCAIHYAGDSGAENIIGASEVWDMNSAQLPEHESDGSINMVSCPQVVGVDDGDNYAVFQQDPDTGGFNITEINDAVPSSCGFSGIAPCEINDSGEISATGSDAAGNTHVLLLVPYALTNLADPYQGSSVIGTSSHNDQDTKIDLVSTNNSTDINSVAWIAAGDASTGGAPRMPKLQASIAAPSGTTVWWKLNVIFHGQNNPANNYRDFDPSATLTSTNIAQLTNVNESGATPGTGYSDDIDIPMPSVQPNSGVQNGWAPIPAGTPWNIYADQDWDNAVARGFFGGDAELSVKITTSDGNTTILPEQDFYFRIAGENPSASACETYIDQQYNGGNASSSPQRWTGLSFTPGTTPPTVPGYWFAYAIAKEETDGDGGRTWYNNFMDNGGQLSSKGSAWSGHEGRPDWNNDDIGGTPQYCSGGYGLFQLTFQDSTPLDPTPEANFIMPRDWIWNWQSNVQQFLPIIQSKLQQT